MFEKPWDYAQGTQFHQVAPNRKKNHCVNIKKGTGKNVFLYRGFNDSFQNYKINQC